MLAGFAPAVFALLPPKREGLSWQDVVVTAVLVSPIISGFTTLFREIYPSPGDPVPRLDYLGKLMVISVGASAFLSLRRVAGADYRFLVNRGDIRTGFRYFLYYLPVGLPFSMAIGLVEWAPRQPLDWKLAGEFLGVALGIFLAVALPEELCFRGVLQNLTEKRVVNRWAALAVGSVAFGAVHLSFRFFPNWKTCPWGGRVGRILRTGVSGARVGDGGRRYAYPYGVDLALPVPLIQNGRMWLLTPH